MLEEGPVDVLWEGGSVCMSGGVGSILRSKDEMSESLGNDCGVGGGMSDSGHRCGIGGGMLGAGDGSGVGEGMLGLRDGCGIGEGMLRLGDGCRVDGEGLGVGTT
nr:hypothetical protein CFP56_05903 [Quercus suber]